MRKPVKTLTFITCAVLSCFLSSAQLKLPSINGLGADVKKVINDYPNRFINLMGEVASQNTQSVDYKCNFNVNGAEESYVTRYSAKKEICSWQALMLTTENFDKAKQKFKSLYNQLNNLGVELGGNKSLHLKGKYESPTEEMKFTSILFSLDPENELASKLKVEITMEYQAPMEWKVKVLVYDREREDAERGKTTESD
jgi:hypothetical protein